VVVQVQNNSTEIQADLLLLRIKIKVSTLATLLKEVTTKHMDKFHPTIRLSEALISSRTILLLSKIRGITHPSSQWMLKAIEYIINISIVHPKLSI
jgi:hypothetical protein